MEGQAQACMLVFVFELALETQIEREGERERRRCLGCRSDGWMEMNWAAAPPTLLGPPVSYVAHMTCLALPASAFFLFPSARTCCVFVLGERVKDHGLLFFFFFFSFLPFSPTTCTGRDGRRRAPGP
jgi:hypothetical protein